MSGASAAARLRPRSAPASISGAGPAGLYLYNGRDAAGRPACLRMAGGRITALVPQPGDLRIDLGGGRLLPGLINAHDHLQLNGLPRLKFRARYDNASQWIADIDPRLQSDPQLLAYRAVPRAQRLLMGGLKNLLSGVTTVAQHDPGDAVLADPGFPVRVVETGWAHSLALEGADRLRESRHRTPAGQPWIIHAAEGLDAAAAAEFDQLDALGCIQAGTVLVHGLALSAEQHQRLAQAGGGLVWCPGSNLHLFGRTLSAAALALQPRLALGSDSRISGECDLLAELALARNCTGWDEARLESLVTEQAAALLGLPDRGRLQPGQLADVLVLPPGLPLSQARRQDLRLVLLGGRPRLAAPDLAAAFGAGSDLVPVMLDGQSTCLSRHLVVALHQALLQEPGVRLPAFVPETAP